jgi:hypothetical protein
MLFLSFLLLFDFVFVQREQGLEKITGHTFATVNITSVSYVNCSFVIPQNDSLFSSYCFGTQDSVTNFYHNASRLVYIFSYDPESSDDPWKSYNPSLPSWAVQDLAVLSRYRGYWIRMSDNQPFTHTGIIKPENTIVLAAGWNLISYPSNDVMHANSTFAGIAGQYSEVVGYNITEGDFVTFIPGLNNNSLNYTTPFQGYWINSTRAQTLIIYDS